MATSKGTIQSTPSITISPSQTLGGDATFDSSLAGIGRGKINFLQGTNTSTPSPQLADEVTDKDGSPFETSTRNVFEDEIDPSTTGRDDSEDNTSETDTNEGEESEDTEALEGFDQEFEKRFGLPVEEARETINSLIAFKDEMALMRGWGISPAEYDSRMKSVKEFFVTLPNEKQIEFNSPEGAKAIWEHLEKQNPSKRTQRKTTNVKSSQKAQQLKKSDILRMPKDEYTRRLPEINQAYRNGLVLEDI